MKYHVFNQQDKVEMSFTFNIAKTISGINKQKYWL